ncbi:MAG: AzlC family ABC transporter permease [Proteobacteria bacterium]|nr:AzlC family ABC transporter permease [Pseudomonadota bacterium]
MIPLSASPDSASPPPGPSSPWPHVWAGVRAGAGLPAFMLMCSLVGVGGLCRDVGYPMGAGIISTLFIWAAPAQMVFFGAVAAGTAMPFIALAVSLSSVRFIPMCMTLLPLLRQPASEGRKGTPTWLLLLLSHYIAVTAWVEGMRRLPPMPREARIPFFLGFSNTIITAATIATGVGYFLIGQLPPPLAAALLFTSPAYFTLALMNNARMTMDWLAIGLSFVLMPVIVRFVPSGPDLMVSGIGIGTLAYLVHRVRREVA